MGPPLCRGVFLRNVPVGGFGSDLISVRSFLYFHPQYATGQILHDRIFSFETVYYPHLAPK